MRQFNAMFYVTGEYAYPALNFFGYCAGLSLLALVLTASYCMLRRWL